MCNRICYGMRTALLSTAAYFTFIATQASVSQTPNLGTPQTPESGEIHRLNERITAQDAQLEAQQAQINALQSGMAEQKALIDKLLQSHEVATVSHYPEEDALLLSA